MFSSNKKQYVNILKQNKQLNLNYKTLQENKILKEEASSFLITDDTMPKDALFKLDTLQKNVPYTYLSTLFEGDLQKVIKTIDVDVIGYEAVKLDNEYSVVVPKNEIISASRYFENSGIDYIISPFSILNEYIQDKGAKNSLNTLIYNNVIYVIILNSLKQIVNCEVKSLTPFDEVHDKEFSDDKIVDQKIYEEVHFLEIQQFLNDTVQKYYSQNENVEFLEQVKVLYTLKPLSDEQVESLYETIMVDVSYEPIDMENYLSKIIQRDNATSFNFINTRTKKQESNIKPWAILAVLSVVIVGGVLYYKMQEPQMMQKESMKKDVVKKQMQKEPMKKAVKKMQEDLIILPNHSLVNNQIQQEIYMLFDVVPYDAVLKDLEVLEDSSTFVSNFAVGSTSILDMQAKLKNIYKDSKILLKHQNKSIINTIMENNKINILKKEVPSKEYKDMQFLSIGKATDYLNALTTKRSAIKYLSKDTKNYLTYKFQVKSLVENPQEFFQFVENLSKQKVSVNIAYPMTFSKVNEGLEVKFNLELKQKHKKSVQPIK